MSDTMNIPVTINSANSTVTNNNRYEYVIPSNLTLRNAECALIKGFIFNSMFNVSKKYFNNDQFQYAYPNGAAMTTRSLTLQSGYYDVNRLNQYLHEVMDTNGEYLLDADGITKIYYLTLNENLVFYANTVTAVPVPTAAEMAALGYTQPPGAPALPPVATTPQLIIQNNNFGKLIGYAQGSYPAVPIPILYEVIGTIPAQINPQYAFNICLSMTNTPLVNSVPNSIFPFSFTVPFLGQQVLDPYQYKYYPCLDGSYRSIIVSIMDQENRYAVLNDPDFQVTIEFRTMKR